MKWTRENPLTTTMRAFWPVRRASAGAGDGTDGDDAEVDEEAEEEDVEVGTCGPRTIECRPQITRQIGACKSARK